MVTSPPTTRSLPGASESFEALFGQSSSLVDWLPAEYDLQTLYAPSTTLADLPSLTDLGFPDPHPAQARMRATKARYGVANCGRRLGKTEDLLAWLSESALAGQPVAYFAPIYPMVEEVYATLEARLAPLVARKVQGHRLELSTGGTLDLWSMSNGGDRARGRKYRRVGLDEAAYVMGLMRVWDDVIRPTLIDLEGEARFASTPRRGSDFERLYRRAESDPDWQAWTFTTWDNPFIPRRELEAARDGGMDKESYAREVMADFEATDSELVYTLDRSKTVRTAPCRWDECKWRVVGIDPGGGDPTAIIPLGVASPAVGSGIHQYGEFVRSGDVTVEHIAEYLNKLGPLDRVFVGETGGNILTNTLIQMGFPAEKAEMRREEGIEHVRWLLQSGTLTIDPTCERSLAEFDVYRWAWKRDQTGASFATRTPDWTHADAHDARRYACLGILKLLPAGMPERVTIRRPRQY